jgi:hypothetical protein
MNDSRILLKVAVSEIGLKSSCSYLGGRTFGIGTTLAIFQHAGTVPCWTEALKMWHIGSEMAKAKSRKNQLGIPSGPGDFRVLICESLRKTS